jgi:AraC-like DNA-binding protein
MVVLLYRVIPKLAVHTVPDKNWVIFVVPISTRSEYLFNGHVVRPFEVFVSAGRDGYASSGEDRFNVAVAIRKPRLIAACSALAGVAAEEVKLADLILPLGQHAGRRLHRTLLDVARHRDSDPIAPGRFPMPEALENDLVSMFARQLVFQVCRVPVANPFPVSALQVVRAATAAGNVLAAPSLSDLCAAAGVSQRWLHKSFVDVTGVSPARYARLARLSKARDLLLASEPDAVSVKRVALSLGFVTSGRFAADYRSVFGENPVDTLRRRCGDRGSG